MANNYTNERHARLCNQFMYHTLLSGNPDMSACRRHLLGRIIGVVLLSPAATALYLSLLLLLL